MSGLSVLREGGVVLLGTDTLPGLRALATHPGAADALRRTKDSPEGRPFLLLFSDLETVLRYARPCTSDQQEELRRAWPGPLTALLRAKRAAPAEWIHEGNSLAARVPAHEELRALIAELGAPLFSTSANLAGEKPAASLAEATRRFPELPVLLGDAVGSQGQASTLVDLTEPEAFVLREGSAPWPPAGSA